MAIKKTVGKNDFMDDFKKCRPENFSYDGLVALYEYLEQLSEDIQEDIELDIVELCCEYEEDSIEYFLTQYNLESIEELEDYTTVIRVNADTIIIQKY
jgi:hypothetical protein